MSAQAHQFVRDFIKKDVIVIFSKSYCPFSRLAKRVFDKMNKTYTAIELDYRADCSDIQDALEKLTGARTVPRVFINGKFVGGGTDVKELYDSGKLQEYFK